MRACCCYDINCTRIFVFFLSFKHSFKSFNVVFFNWNIFHFGFVNCALQTRNIYNWLNSLFNFCKTYSDNKSSDFTFHCHLSLDYLNVQCLELVFWLGIRSGESKTSCWTLNENNCILQWISVHLQNFWIPVLFSFTHYM